MTGRVRRYLRSLLITDGTELRHGHAGARIRLSGKSLGCLSLLLGTALLCQAQGPPGLQGSPDQPDMTIDAATRTLVIEKSLA
ncbi:MAG TPA: hypothetical protein VEZ90_09315, partial [Blastocatellia bacterium]|nr:hypothetical protein [Blastocatellia bacterium]